MAYWMESRTDAAARAQRRWVAFRLLLAAPAVLIVQTMFGTDVLADAWRDLEARTWTWSGAGQGVVGSALLASSGYHWFLRPAVDAWRLRVVARDDSSGWEPAVVYTLGKDDQSELSEWLSGVAIVLERADRGRLGLRLVPGQPERELAPGAPVHVRLDADQRYAVMRTPDGSQVWPRGPVDRLVTLATPR